MTGPWQACEGSGANSSKGWPVVVVAAVHSVVPGVAEGGSDVRQPTEQPRPKGQDRVRW